MADGAGIYEGTDAVIDTDELDVDGQLRHRQRIQVAGATGPEVTRVGNDEPLNTDYGLVTRPVGVTPLLQDVKRSLTDYETRLDYAARTDGNPVYVGKAVQGAATADPVWTIQHLSYDSQGRLLRAQVLSAAAWDNRATLGWSA